MEKKRTLSSFLKQIQTNLIFCVIPSEDMGDVFPQLNDASGDSEMDLTISLDSKKKYIVGYGRYTKREFTILEVVEVIKYFRDRKGKDHVIFDPHDLLNKLI